MALSSSRFRVFDESPPAISVPYQVRVEHAKRDFESSYVFTVPRRRPPADRRSKPSSAIPPTNKPPLSTPWYTIPTRFPLKPDLELSLLLLSVSAVLSSTSSWVTQWIIRSLISSSTNFSLTLSFSPDLKTRIASVSHLECFVSRSRAKRRGFGLFSLGSKAREMCWCSS